jgi:hypothetical protein
MKFNKSNYINYDSEKTVRRGNPYKLSNGFIIVKDTTFLLMDGKLIRWHSWNIFDPDGQITGFAGHTFKSAKDIVDYILVDLDKEEYYD